MGTEIAPERCPQCGSYNIQKIRRSINYKGTAAPRWECLACAHDWALPAPRGPRERPSEDDERGQ